MTDNVTELKPVESASPTTTTVSTPEPQKERLQNEDFLHLQLAQQKKLTAVAEAKTALANNEKVELEYKVLVQAIFNKYGMTAADGLSETGEIMRGANAAQVNQNKQ